VRSGLSSSRETQTYSLEGKMMAPSIYRWRKTSDVNRDYALFELMCGETALLDLGFSDDETLEIAFNANISGKILGWTELLELLEEGKALAELDR
jgi:hypothetical protein